MCKLTVWGKEGLLRRTREGSAQLDGLYAAPAGGRQLSPIVKAGFPGVYRSPGLRCWQQLPSATGCRLTRACWVRNPFFCAHLDGCEKGVEALAASEGCRDLGEVVARRRRCRCRQDDSTAGCAQDPAQSWERGVGEARKTSVKERYRCCWRGTQTPLAARRHIASTKSNGAAHPPEERQETHGETTRSSIRPVLVEVCQGRGAVPPRGSSRCRSTSSCTSVPP